MNPPDDLPRDEHLRQALRHAPDRERQAPDLLSASILAAARREATPAPGRWRRILRGSAGLPWQGAGTLAAVLLVSGVLWVQRDALPPAVESGEPAAAPSVASAEPAVVSEPAAGELRSVAPAQHGPPPAKATAPAAPPEAQNAAPPQVSPASRPARPLPQPPAPSISIVEAQPEAAVRAAREAAGQAAHQAERQTARPSEPQPRPAAPIDAPAGEARPGAAVADTAVALEARPAAVPAPTAAEAATLSAPPPAAARQAATAIALAPETLAVPTHADIDAHDAWSTATAGATPRPWPAGWLQALKAATPAWSNAGAEDLAEAGPREITLWQQGQARGRLRLGQRHVVWCPAGRACQVSAADPTALAALRTALPPD